MIAAAALLLLAAQSQRHPSTQVISIGLALNLRTELWSISGQPVPASNTTGLDTMGFGRALAGGFGGLIAYTRYPSPMIGLRVEAGTFSLKSEQRCEGPLVYRPDPDQLNQQACTSAMGRGRRGNLLAIQAGPVLRANAGGPVEPFVRLTAGVGMVTGSTIETVGFTSSGMLVLMEEESQPAFSLVATLAGGITADISPGSRLRLEVRDFTMPLLRATGPGPITPLGQIVPTRRHWTHRLSVLFGFDLELDRRHLRRY